MKQQTAVDWLWDILTTSFWEYKTFEEQKEIIEKARQMEKDQIIDAYKADLYPCSDEDAEQYYNETYKSE